MNDRKRWMEFCEKNHGQLHVLFGTLAWVGALIIFGGEPVRLFLVSVLGAYFPDADHLLFIFGYGRSAQYAIDSKKSFFEGGIPGFLRYVKKNHKGNTRIYSHNLLSLGLVIGLSVWSVLSGNRILGGVFFSWSLHYVFDILEDLLFFGKLNGNWWLRFGK